MINSISPSLLQIATATRKTAQEFLNYNNKIYWMSIIFSCIALYFSDVISWLFIIFAFLIRIVGFCLYIKGLNYHYLSREAQRLALLEDSFGNIVDSFQSVELRTKINKKIEEVAKKIKFSRGYYTGSEELGNLRLKKNIHQSTFWSRTLLEIHGRNLRNISYLSIFIVIFSFFFVIGIEHDFNIMSINPYQLSAVCINIFLGFFDNIKNIIQCFSSCKMLYDVDQRLEKIDINNNEILLASYADYSIATVTAPPIPHNVYKKNRDRLVSLWEQRICSNGTSLECLYSKGNDIKYEIDNKNIPNWMSELKLRTIIKTASIQLANYSKSTLPEKISVKKIDSYSTAMIYDIILMKNGTTWRHLILRLHPVKDDAEKEFNIIKRIEQECIDILTFVPFSDQFLNDGAIFYYHADTQTFDNLYHFDNYVFQFLNSRRTNIETSFLKVFSGLKTLTKVFDRLTDNYKIVPLNQYLNSLLSDCLFPEYVIDLRNKSFFISNNILIIENLSMKSNDDTQELYLNTNEELLFSFKILNKSSYSYSIVHNILICINDINCILLTTQEVPENIIKISINPRKNFMSFYDFYRKDSQLDISFFNPTKELSLINKKFPNQGISFAYRHNDFHTENCLISESNFKVIDIFDSTETLCCADLARLEISLISSLIKSLKLTQKDINKIYNISSSNDEGENSYLIDYISKLLKEIRECFYSSYLIKPTELDIDIAYYVEIYKQISYSISSPNKLPPQMYFIIKYWNDKLIQN